VIKGKKNSWAPWKDKIQLRPGWGWGGGMAGIKNDGGSEFNYNIFLL
jgi:hypothetical protein